MKAVKDEPFAAFIPLSSSKTASGMQETSAKSIQVLEGQSSAAVKLPVASKPATTTLYKDHQGREGMALRRYGGDFPKLKQKGFAWQDRKKDGKTE